METEDQLRYRFHPSIGDTFKTEGGKVVIITGLGFRPSGRPYFKSNHGTTYDQLGFQTNVGRDRKWRLVCRI